MAELTAHRLYHTGPRKVEWRTEALVAPGPGEVLVRTRLTAISGGTEGLFFRGDLDEETRLDGLLLGLTGKASYPFRYGYCLFGVVEALGSGVAQEWAGRRVFAFEPHCSAFVAPVTRLHPVPDAVPDRRAVLFPLAETAVSLVMDAAPLWGERAAVVGLGPLGALTAGLLSEFPLGALSLRDPLVARRERVKGWLGRAAPSPEADDTGTCDLAFDVGGRPSSAAAAVRALGHGGRLILASWQGNDFLIPGAGTDFHRKRLRIVTSQVSTLAPELTARWSPERRAREVWRRLADWPVEGLISHELPFQSAQDALTGLQDSKHDYFQVVLQYE